MKVPKQLITFLKKETHFLIATHISPEADAIGSSLALSMAIESLGKKTIIYDKDPVPPACRFLPGYENFVSSLPDINPSAPLVLVDCNKPERAGLSDLNFSISAVIDHHETENGFGDVRWIEPNAPATGAMIYHVIKELGINITKEIATNLYAAISIDTGTFRYSNTTPEVLRIGAELIEIGVDPAFVSENLYQSWSENRFRLLLNTLNTVEIYDDVAITTVTDAMFKGIGADPADTENFPNFTQMMKHINISVLIRELEKDYFKVSLRSKNRSINVAKVAEIFNGGGHKNAAGFRIRADLKTLKENILSAIRKKS
ncbi:MAG: bifunctional oligoribonuclease/PAP phosphatase NrnA [Nitrospiraceae bacterium]|nr:bifunctional oligoribonuclease/PAP phosphatase NrnA [Nitrospiraceae bacterium]